MSVRRKNDLLWKGMLEVVLDDVLRFIFKDADQLFNLQKKFEFLDKELNELYPVPENKAALRIVDTLVKIFRYDGREEWLLLHIEVQDRNSPNFPERMFQYYYRIFDRYRKPVTAVAIFTGKGTANVRNCYKYSCLGTRLEYVYNTLRIADYSDEALESNPNPFSLVMLAAKKALLPASTSDPVRLKHKLLVAKTLLLRKDLSHTKIKAILAFLSNYVLFKDNETKSIFTKEIDQITNKKYNMDIFEQIVELRAEEANEEALRRENRRTRRIVRNLLKQSNLSMTKIAAVAEVPLDFVKKVKKSIRTK